LVEALEEKELVEVCGAFDWVCGKLKGLTGRRSDVGGVWIAGDSNGEFYRVSFRFSVIPNFLLLPTVFRAFMTSVLRRILRSSKEKLLKLLKNFQRVFLPTSL
jgi:hypothetical protein